MFSLRGKTKTITPKPNGLPLTLADLPEWNFDGSSTGQSTGANSDVLIKPVAMFPYVLPTQVIHQHHPTPHVTLSNPTRDSIRPHT